MAEIYHYPPGLLALLSDTIPLLCRSKDDVLLFFRGAGVDTALTRDLAAKLRNDRASVTKFEIVRTVLRRLNDKGDAQLRQRREVLKRVVEFQDFSVCWEDDRLKAKGLVAEIREVVHAKDAFTRMESAYEQERRERAAVARAYLAENANRAAALRSIKSDLYDLFREPNPHRRGKALESVLNRLFSTGGVSVREAFTLASDEGKGIISQIDGVIEVDGDLYLVEMKWWSEPLGHADIAPHIVNVYSRADVGGLLISASGYTESSAIQCRDALNQKTIVLCELREIVTLLEEERDIKWFLREKIRAARIDKHPFYEPLARQSVAG